MARDVFLSYASEDRAAAEAICGSLEGTGLGCWMAPRDVPAGTSYAGSIIDGINGARVLVLVFTEHSNRSPQVLREVERAVAKGTPILPFRLEDVALTKDMEFLISSQHWLDGANPPTRRHLEALGQQVARLVAPPTGTAPARPSPPSPRRGRAQIRETLLRLPALLAVVYGVAGVILGLVLALNEVRSRHPWYAVPLAALGLGACAAVAGWLLGKLAQVVGWLLDPEAHRGP
jgi:hypothetical protein